MNVHIQLPRLSATMMSAAAMALLLSATAADARKSKGDDGLVADGEPVDCISLSQIRSSRVRDDQTIDFEVSGRKIYRNTLPYRCSGLGFEEKFAFKTSQSQLCSVDLITVLNNFGGGLSQGPSCGLGKFQPMTKAGK